MMEMDEGKKNEESESKEAGAYSKKEEERELIENIGPSHDSSASVREVLLKSESNEPNSSSQGKVPASPEGNNAGGSSEKEGLFGTAILEQRTEEAQKVIADLREKGTALSEQEFRNLYEKWSKRYEHYQKESDAFRRTNNIGTIAQQQIEERLEELVQVSHDAVEELKKILDAIAPEEITRTVDPDSSPLNFKAPSHAIAAMEYKEPEPDDRISKAKEKFKERTHWRLDEDGQWLVKRRGNFDWSYKNPPRYTGVSRADPYWSSYFNNTLFSQLKDPFRNWFFRSDLLDPSKFGSLAAIQALLTSGKNYQNCFLEKFNLVYEKHSSVAFFLSKLTGVQQTISHFKSMAELIGKLTVKREEWNRILNVPNLPQPQGELIRSALRNIQPSLNNAILFGTHLGGDDLTQWNPHRALPARGRAEAYKGKAEAAIASLNAVAEEKQVREDQVKIYDKKLTLWNAYESAQNDKQRVLLKSQAEAYENLIVALKASLETADPEQKQAYRKEAVAWASVLGYPTCEPTRIIAESYEKERAARKASLATKNQEKKNAYQNEAKAWKNFIRTKALSSEYFSKIFRSDDRVDESRFYECYKDQSKAYRDQAEAYGKQVKALDVFFRAGNDEEKEVSLNQVKACEKQVEACVKQVEALLSASSRASELFWNYSASEPYQKALVNQAKAYQDEATAWGFALEATNYKEKEMLILQAKTCRKQAEVLEALTKITIDSLAPQKTRAEKASVDKKRAFYEYQIEIYGTQIGAWNTAALVWNAFFKAPNNEEREARQSQAKACENQAELLGAFAKAITEKEHYGFDVGLWLAATKGWKALIKSFNNEARQVSSSQEKTYEKQAKDLGVISSVVTPVYYDFNRDNAYRKEVAAWDAFLKATNNEEKEMFKRQAEACRKEAAAWNAFGRATTPEEKAKYENQAEAYQENAIAYSNLLTALDKQTAACQGEGKIRWWNNNLSQRIYFYEVSYNPYDKEARKTMFDKQVAAYTEAKDSWDQWERATTDQKKAAYQNQARAYKNQGEAYDMQESRMFHESIYDDNGKVNEIKKRVREVGLDLFCNSAAAYGREALAWCFAAKVTILEKRRAHEKQASSYRKQAEGYEHVAERYWNLGRKHDLTSTETRSLDAYEKQINRYGEQAQLYKKQAFILSKAETVDGEQKEGLLKQATALSNQAEIYNMLGWEVGPLDRPENFQLQGFYGAHYYYGAHYSPTNQQVALCTKKAKAYASEAAAWAKYAEATTREERMKHRALAEKYQQQAMNADNASCVIN